MDSETSPEQTETTEPVKQAEYVTKEEFTDFKQETGSKLDAILEHTKPKDVVVGTKETVIQAEEAPEKVEEVVEPAKTVSAEPPPKKEKKEKSEEKPKKGHWMYSGIGYRGGSGAGLLQGRNLPRQTKVSYFRRLRVDHTSVKLI